MTEVQKDILIKDLCARLDTNLVCSIYRVDDYGVGYRDEILSGYCKGDKWREFYFGDDYGIGIDDVSKIKPYLFPLSSMTEEQKKELFKFCEFYIQENGEGKNEEVYGIEIARRPDPAYCYDHTFRIWGIDMRAINWLLKNHFDIYGLIPMGLAIDATGLNIY